MSVSRIFHVLNLVVFAYVQMRCTRTDFTIQTTYINKQSIQVEVLILVSAPTTPIYYRGRSEAAVTQRLVVIIRVHAAFELKFVAFMAGIVRINEGLVALNKA